MMKKDYDNLIQEANTIKSRGLVLLIADIVLLLIVSIIFPIVFATSFNNPYQTIPAAFLAIWIILFIIYFILMVIFSIMVTIKLSSIDWGNDFLNNDKSIYCVLTWAFFLTIGFMAPVLWIVWGNKAKNIYSKLNKDINNLKDSQV